MACCLLYDFRHVATRPRPKMNLIADTDKSSWPRNLHVHFEPNVCAGYGGDPELETCDGHGAGPARNPTVRDEVAPFQDFRREIVE
jgi:hypothetical protein